MLTSDDFNAGGAENLPGLLGIVITGVTRAAVTAHLPVRTALMAPNGYLHAGTVVALADTCAGYGCIANLPPGASGFTTIELKSNHVGTAKQGTLACVATPVHVGRTTQVWDAVVTHQESGKVWRYFAVRSWCCTPLGARRRRASARQQRFGLCEQLRRHLDAGGSRVVVDLLRARGSGDRGRDIRLS